MEEGSHCSQRTCSKGERVTFSSSCQSRSREGEEEYEAPHVLETAVGGRLEMGKMERWLQGEGMVVLRNVALCLVSYSFELAAAISTR